VPYYDIDDVTQDIVNRLDANKVTLGLANVVYGDERLVKEFPAILVEPGIVDRVIHGTQQWELQFHVVLWIYHAKLTIGRSQRLKEDIQLSNGVVTYLHEDKSLNGNIIFGFVEQEAPGVIARGPTNSVIGTRLSWYGRVVQPW